MAYTLTIDPIGLKLVETGRRKGIELEWRDLISEEAALAAALQASVRASASNGASTPFTAEPWNQFHARLHALPRHEA